ncbi:hypothetical protein L0152_07165 [bacterium]|nr:hypothetical protein [bacterium]
MGTIETIEKVRLVIEGILGIVAPISAAIPIIQNLLGQLPPPVQQEFPPERIKEIIDAYEAREKELDEKFLPPSEDEDEDDGADE